MNSKRIDLHKTAVALVMSVIATGSSARLSAAEDAAVPVETATAIAQSEVEPMWVPGTVVSRRDSNIAPGVAGRIVWLADIGDRVDAGEPVARIDDEAWRIRLRADDAEIRRLDANIGFLDRQVDRFVELADSNGTAAAEVDRLTMELRMLEQEHAAAIARRDQTRRELDLSKVIAPFPGVIVERSVEIGEFARVGDALLRIIDTDSVEVVARAPVDVARHMRPGSTVALQREAGAWRTEVRALFPSGDERSRGIELRVALPRGEWLVGDAVRVAVEDGSTAISVAIPRDALVLRDAQVYVFRLRSDATAERVAVRVGGGVDDLVAVEGDVSPGDKVVVRGAERLKDGQPVRILTDGAFARMRGSRVDSG